MSQEPTVSDSTTQIEPTSPAAPEGATEETTEVPAPEVPAAAPEVPAPAAEAPAARPGPSVPTVVWGLILALVAAAAIVHQVSNVDVNLTVGVPVVLLAVGAALVAWGVAGLARKRR
jgi:hypothetical protein